MVGEISPSKANGLKKAKIKIGLRTVFKGKARGRESNAESDQ